MQKDQDEALSGTLSRLLAWFCEVAQPSILVFGEKLAEFRNSDSLMRYAYSLLSSHKTVNQPRLRLPRPFLHLSNGRIDLDPYVALGPNDRTVILSITPNLKKL